jgi:hypothetical protein
MLYDTKEKYVLLTEILALEANALIQRMAVSVQMNKVEKKNSDY